MTMSKTEDNSKYEWLGEDDELTGEKDTIAKGIMGSDCAEGYVPPVREYDDTVNADKEYIASLPDLQNGPSSLIQGAPVAIQQVGIHNFKLPLNYKKRNGKTIELETSVTGSVSLEAHKKGINMSRIMRSFYDHKDETFSIDKIKDVLTTYKENLKSFDSRIMLKISYPIKQTSLRSGLEGYQYYDVVLEGILLKMVSLRSIFTLTLFIPLLVLVALSLVSMLRSIVIVQQYLIVSVALLVLVLDLKITCGLKIFMSFA